jgi:PAS domain S-box-containing protein
MQKILAIDDLKEYLTLLSSLLKRLFPGAVIFTALSGDEGLRIAQEEQPDVILLDVVMPDMDGYDVCRLLKAHPGTRHIPVIMVTGLKIDADGRLEAVESGADAFLSKPIGETELFTQVKAMLRIKAAEDRLRGETDSFKFMVETGSRDLWDEGEKQKEVKETDRLYADIVDNMQLGLHLYHQEDTDNDRSLRMIYANPAGARIIGHKEDELVGKTLDENFPDLREKGIPQQYAEIIRTGKPMIFEDIAYGNERLPLSHFLVRAFPLPNHCLGVLFEDISQRRRAEIALAESEEKFRLLFDHMLDAFAFHKMIFDENGEPVDYRFLDANPAFEENTGLKKPDIIGKTVKEVLPDTESFWIKKYGEVVKTGKSARFDHFSAALGGYYEVSAFCAKSGEFAAIYRNVTEQKKSERKATKSLKEKDLLLRDIHHRIKNNLTMVSSLLNIQSNYISDQKARDAFKESRKRIRAIALLHEKLYRSVDIARVEFGEYVRELVDALIKSTSVPRADIELIIEIRDIYFGANTAVPLGLIITELVTNALKYGLEKEKTLRILIDLNSANNDRNRYGLTVSDSGPGIPSEMDWRNTETLGIQLVIMLAEQLEGEIELKGNGGTTFYISFPKPAENQRNAYV